MVRAKTRRHKSARKSRVTKRRRSYRKKRSIRRGGVPPGNIMKTTKQNKTTKPETNNNNPNTTQSKKKRNVKHINLELFKPKDVQKHGFREASKNNLGIKMPITKISALIEANRKSEASNRNTTMYRNRFQQ